MKKIKIIFRSFLFIILLHASIEVFPQFCGGNGTPQFPYQVCDLPSLELVSSYLNSYFIQTNDITIGFLYNQPNGWLPIGDLNNPFTGSYNGNGYVITDMLIERPSTDNIGLFGYTFRATLTNIGINDSEVYGADNVGLLVGYALQTIITDCNVHSIAQGINNVGGMIGFASQSKLHGCEASVDVLAGNGELIGGNAGGLVGLSMSSLINDCSIMGEYPFRYVTSNNVAGGLVGYLDRQSSVYYCRVHGVVPFAEKYVGGLVGVNTDRSVIEQSVAEETIINVSNSSIVGGLVGLNSERAEIISNGIYNIRINYGVCMIGGIVGLASSNSIIRDNTVNNVDLTAADAYCVGGIAGHAEDYDIQDNTLFQVYSYGYDYVGMFIGTETNGNFQNNTTNGGSNSCVTNNYCGAGDPFGKDNDYCPCLSNKRSAFEFKEEFKEQISIYPNPSDTYFTIESSTVIKNIRIFDYTGKLTYEKEIEDYISSVNLSNFARGLYFLQIETETETKYRKLIKK